MPSISRRSAVGLLGVGVLAGALANGADCPAAGVVGPEAVLGKITVGSRFARWTVVAIHPVVDGALTLTVAGEDGHQFRLEIMKRDASPLAPRPPAEAGDLAIYVSNNGDGWMPTVEEQGLAAMTLAEVLDRQDLAPVDGLLTHAQRVAAHRDTLLVHHVSPVVEPLAPQGA